MFEDHDYYLKKAEEFEAKAAAEQFENIRQAYRKLAADYRKLAAGPPKTSPPLVPEQNSSSPSKRKTGR
jgi:hypothetical protein